MLDDQRVVAFTPYGREVTVSVLYPYLKRDHNKGLLDEWMLCMNTDPTGQQDDIVYAEKLAEENDWINLYYLPQNLIHRMPKQLNTGGFYMYMTDPDTTYVRFDDDIIYVHKDAIENMVKRAVASRSTLVTFPIIWNNAVATWHLQVRGIVPIEWGKVEPYCMDPMGWADGAFAIKMHELLLDKIAADEVESLFMYQDVQLAPGQQFSVSCFAVQGKDYAILEPPGYLDYAEEEHWHTVHRPLEVGKSNVIAGDALVSHYTFYPQRSLLLGTDILDRYRALAEGLDKS